MSPTDGRQSLWAYKYSGEKLSGALSFDLPVSRNPLTMMIHRSSKPLLLIASTIFSFNFVGAVDPLVDVGYTKYQGSALGNGITQWLGIRYAAPPLGDLRYAKPADPPVNNTIQVANKVRAPAIEYSRSTYGWPDELSSMAMCASAQAQVFRSQHIQRRKRLIH